MTQADAPGGICSGAPKVGRMDAARQKILDQVGQGLLSQAQADKMLAMMDGLPRLPSASSSAAPPLAVAARDVVQGTLGAGAFFTLVNEAGDVRVTHTSAVGTVRVEREATAATAEEAQRLLQTVQVDIRDDGVTVRAGEPGARAVLEVALGELETLNVEGEFVRLEGIGGDVSCSAETGVEAHRMGGALDVRAQNGDVVVSDASSRLLAHLSNGSLHVVDASGHLEATCLNGDATVEGFAGDVELRVPNGEARVRNLRGTVKARVGSGALRLHDVEASIDGRVGSGAVEAVLKPTAGLQMMLETKQGDVMIRVPHDASLEVALRARGGQCHCMPPAEAAWKDGGWTRLRMGDAAATLQVESGQGSIVLERVDGEGPSTIASIDQVS